MDATNEEQERVMTLLEPIMNEIHAIFPAALNRYNEIDPAIRSEHENRTVANCIRDHALLGFQTAFEGRRGFHFLDVRGLELLNIRDEVLIRIKKVDANGKHSNYQTAQQKAFDSYGENENLVGLPSEAVRIVVGYQPDLAYSEIERVIVRQTKGDWVSQINAEDGHAAWVDITPAQLPFANTRHASSR